MIPKTIHYCWFGGNPLPELAQKCIASWKKFCPDYEIIEWNESNYDISSAPIYVRQAYEAKKWGFVPDYIRLELIYEYGGIYLDTDVELIRPLDDLIPLKGFAGFEDKKHVALGLGFGAEKGNPIIKALMESYNPMLFIYENGSLNLTPSPVLNTEILLKLGLKSNGAFQKIDGFTFFPQDYFSPMDFYSGRIQSTKNTYSIHHFMASWFSDENKYIKDKRVTYAKYMPLKLAHWLSLIVGFTKFRGIFKMPKAMIDFKIDNMRKIKKEIDEKNEL